jgi:hypothetical protein
MKTIWGLAITFALVGCGSSDDSPASEVPADSGETPADTSGGSSDTGGGSEDTGSEDTGGTGGDTGGTSDTATDSGPTGTPVTVTVTTPTTPIPAMAMACSGDTYGSKGDLTAINTPVFVATDSVSSLILRYDMGYYFGEPTRRATISWEGMGSLSSVQWLAEVQDKSGKQYVSSTGKRVWASYNLGTIPGPGAGFGTDSTGSPNWSATFVTYDDAMGVVFNSVSDVDAKGIYKACFKLANVRVLQLNGKPALKP